MQTSHLDPEKNALTCPLHCDTRLYQFHLKNLLANVPENTFCR